MPKHWKLFHTRAGFLGSWQANDSTSPHLAFSFAYGCQHCGEVWLRKLAVVEGVKPNWIFFSSDCESCKGLSGDGNGSLFHKGNLLTEFKAGVLPIEALTYEFNLEYETWQRLMKVKAAKILM